MRDSFKIILLALLVSILARGFDVGYVMATLPAQPSVWDTSTFEGAPGASDVMSEGDDHMRRTKVEIRGRLETEHHFGTNEDAGDDGRHREGSCMIFMQDAAPTAITVNDYHNGTNAAANATLEQGRVWADTNNGNTLYTYDAAFEEAIAIPTGVIVLWDDPNGDEDCDGSETAGDCPCGFTRTDAFDGLMARGALAVGADPNDIYMVPDVVGARCDMSAPGYSVAAACNADPNTSYDDTLDIAEMPLHGHPARYQGTGGVVNDADGGIMVENSDDSNYAANTGAASATLGNAIGGTGGATEHLHPFISVLFCKKS